MSSKILMFLLGVGFYANLLGFYQDLKGKEAYLKKIDQTWVNGTLWLHVLLLVLIILLFSVELSALEKPEKKTKSGKI